MDPHLTKITLQPAFHQTLALPRLEWLELVETLLGMAVCQGIQVLDLLFRLAVVCSCVAPIT